MSQQEERDSDIKAVAVETLAVFDAIADKAKKELLKRSGQSSGVSALVYSNTATGSETAINNIDVISDQNKEDLSNLIRKPAFARVLVADEDGKQHLFYISRRGNVSLEHESAKLISYQHPIGRLASLPVGDDEEVEFKGKSQYFEVLESSIYRPFQKQQLWDSRSTILRFASGTYTVESLLELLNGVSEDADDLLDSILGGSGEVEILAGLRHEVRTSAALRDQAILDKFQDKIFRLPLNNQLLIIGPPGTGKTTTLIRRLGQKLTEQALSYAEKALVIQGDDDIRKHQDSWIMFTPTDLLKHFVKEAFNREQVSVSATDERIKTWDSYRSDIARRVLGVLQTTGANGKFIFKDNTSFINKEIQQNPIDWYEDFKAYHLERIISQLHQGISILEKLVSSDNESLIGQLKVITSNSSAEKIQPLFAAFYQLETQLDKQIKKLKLESDEEIRKTLTLLINKEGGQFVEDLVTLLENIQSSEEVDEDDGDNEFDNDTEEEQEGRTGSITKKQAVQTYRRALRSLARYRYQKRIPPQNSTAAKLSHWLGSRLPTDDKLLEIGLSIATQNGLRRFQKIFNRYVVDVPSSYKEFRKKSLKMNSGQYEGKPKNNKHIDATELDAIILLMLKNARELLGQRFVINDLDKPAFNTLNIISQQFKNQVFVDEATDFSALQLAAMESLTSLKTRSFFACGDFNQRISSWGIRSKDQMQWVSNQIIAETINIVYRQSKKLNLFAGELLQQFGGDMSSRGALPEEMKNEGFSPVLLESASELDDLTMWLLERLKEVERIAGLMPTVAVLVNSEDEVKPMAVALNEVVEEINLRAVACSDGQSLGEGTDIRVFDVKHIKGLEFEAVFFVGVDILEEQMPELFSKYLYVGATRAATHFGLSCEKKLPDSLEPLRHLFTDNWKPSI